MVLSSVQKEYVTRVKLYACYSWVPGHLKAMLMDAKGDANITTIK